MNKKMRIPIGLIGTVGWALVLPILVYGQSFDSAGDLYGRGVHAYFAGRSGEADLLLSRAMEIQTRDPRLYYFRALSRLRQGRAEEAHGDMAAGAALEAERLNRYAVGPALARVQGSDRLLLEQFRRDARSKAVAARAEFGREQHGLIAANDTEVLREKVVIPLDELLRSGGPRPLSADEMAPSAAAAAPLQPADNRAASPATAANDPFRDDVPQPSDAETPAPPPASSPTLEKQDADEDPFNDF